MLKLAIPVMIQNFISSFLNMIDTVMVGKLGETAIAAVGIANQYFFFFMMFMIGLSAGCAVFIAQFWGTKDVKNIRRILGMGLTSVLLVATIFVVVGLLAPRRIIMFFTHESEIIAAGAQYLQIILISYLFTAVSFIYNFAYRSIGNSFQPMLISLVALFCNAFFNYVLIFGKLGAPAMGVAGAAVATVIARVVETLVLVVSVYRRPGALTASFGELTAFDFGFVKRAYRTIIPVLLNDICWGTASLIYAAVYGRMGTQAVASIQIVNTITNLFMVFVFGLSSAAAVMIGNTIGAGDVELTREYAKRFSRLAMITGLVLGLLLAVAAPYLLSIFNVSRAVRSYTLFIIYTVALVFFIRVYNIIIIVGVLRGGGDARSAFFLEGFTMWFIGVPLTVVGAFVFKLPVYLVYGLSVFEEITKALLCRWRYRSGQWLRNVTHSLG
ncbi:MAG TPA: MATE family efflux transporter [Firmicutes bacterium]|jgi:putative MATE family efflux protein|nr:MATE family efflux transporter [Bacillota bacterium]